MPSQAATGRKSGLVCESSTETPQDTNAELIPDKPKSSKDPSIHSEEEARASNEPIKCVVAVSSTRPPPPLRSSLKLEFDRTQVRRLPRHVWSRTNRHWHSTIDENDISAEETQPPERPPITMRLRFNDQDPSRSSSSLSTGLKTSLSWSPGVLRHDKQDLEFSIGGAGAENRSLSMDDRMTRSVDLRLLVARVLPNGARFRRPTDGSSARGKRTSSPAGHQGDAGAVSTNSDAVSYRCDPVKKKKRKASLPVRTLQEDIDGTRGEVRSALNRRKTVDIPRLAPECNDHDRSRHPTPGIGMRRTLRYLSKEELLFMWKASERALNRQLKDALMQSEELQTRILSTGGQTVT